MQKGTNRIAAIQLRLLLSCMLSSRSRFPFHLRTQSHSDGVIFSMLLMFSRKRSVKNTAREQNTGLLNRSKIARAKASAPPPRTPADSR